MRLRRRFAFFSRSSFFGRQPQDLIAANQLQQRTSGTLEVLVEPRVERDNDVGVGPRSIGLFQPTFNHPDQRGLADTPAARDADRNRGAVRLLEEFRARVRYDTEIQVVDGRFVV